MPSSSLTDHDRSLHEFWEASSLDRFRLPGFAARLLAYQEPARPVAVTTPPGAAVALRPVRDRFQRLLEARRSEREFSDRPLRHRQVGRILAATGPGRGGRRVVPEAGGLTAIHVHALVRHAQGPLAGQVVRYDHALHAASPLRPVPEDAELRTLFQLEGTSLPQLILLFAVELGPVVAKYGSRGGRFALQQLGHAAQSVGLRLAADRMRGYVLGGGLDVELLRLVGLAHTELRYGSAMACGR